jgi:phenylpyruvate tautomerase PptA (4-oxalocrotonate tautomerase family)
MSFGPVRSHYLWTRTVRAVSGDHSERRFRMPVVFIEAPPGVRADAKKRMVEKITTALDEVYPIGETLIFLREYPLENVAVNGRLTAENPQVLDAVEKIKTA